jgi:penicillin-binding protein 2
VPQRIEDRVRPITPQLAWRVAVLGGIAFVLFGIVFFRLWYLQVLSGQDYVTQASENRVRKERIEAPRGDIVDRHGETLVRTKRAAVVQIRPSSLPESVLDQADQYRKDLAAAETERLKAADRYEAYSRQLRDDGKKDTRSERKQRSQLRRESRQARRVAIPAAPPQELELNRLYRRMGEVLGIRPRTIHERVIRGVADTPFSNVTIRTDVDSAEFEYMRERPEYFPGVEVTKRYLRQYPHDKLAAQLFGTISEITEEQRKDPKYSGIEQGTRIGQSGLEAEYDKYLRGVDGYSRVVVDAFGSRDEQRRLSVREPKQGERLKLTLDYDLQRAGDRALSQAIAASLHGAKAGAYVAMDPRDGAILAMGSQPGFDASVFARPFSQTTYENLTSQEKGAPLLNRATESAYPIGSVFKPVTALAALEEKVLTVNQTMNDTGKYELGPQKYQNAKGAVFGTINLREAMTVSSDVFFYHLGEWLDAKGPELQKWAKRLGFGRDTDVDLSGERPGLVPDRKWRDGAYAEYQECVKKAGLNQGTTAALYACGGVERGWSTGDNVNLAVGQGDLQATPLQVAVAYSAIANNGTIVRPHLGKAIEDGNGVTVQELRVKPRRKIKIPARYRDTILDGLRGAANAEGGTSTDIFKDFPSQYTVYGKTGTAERQPNPDQSWYACFVKDGGRPIVVVVTVERGGFGAETAAPAARLILDEWFDTGKTEFQAGSDQSN